jgi:hypothetical protein
MIGAMPDHPAKITFGEMRESGVRSIQIYCKNHGLIHKLLVILPSPNGSATVGTDART